QQRSVRRREESGRQRALHPEQRDRSRHAGSRREERRDEEGDRLEALEHEVEGSDRLLDGAVEVNTRDGARRLAHCARRLVQGAGCEVMVLAAAVPAAAQGRITNARTETRSAAQGLEREMRAVAARPGVSWAGYKVPMVAGPRQMCCYDSIGDN